MRLSIDRNDSDQDMSICNQATVRCNGISLDCCYMADEEKGEAQIYLKRANGDLVPGIDGNALKVMIQGDIQIILGDK